MSRDGKLRGSPAISPGAIYATYNIHPVHGAAPVRLGTRIAGSERRIRIGDSGAAQVMARYP
jgi:hypothetical protein